MKLLFLTFVIFWLSPKNETLAQQISETEMQKALLTWQKKAADSIKTYRAESDKIRTTMRGLVKQLGHDPMFILGPEDGWISEDMNILFKGAPTGMLVHIERDPRQTQLENNHVALYWADLKVYRWKKIKHTVDSVLKIETPLATWLGYENNPDDTEKMSLKKAQIFLNQRIASQLWYDNSTLFPEGNILLKKEKTKPKKENPQDFVFSNNDLTKFLIQSYPAQGQYNFYINEDLEYKGFAYFEKDSFLTKFEPMFAGDWTYSLVWKDNKKYRNEKGVSPTLGISTPPGFNFSIPKDLKPATLYQLQIVATMFEEQLQKSKKVILWENYIRTSKYSLVDKILAFKEQRPVYDRQKGSFEVEIDEPFDVIELSARNLNGKKLFEFSSEGTTGQEADYYAQSNEISYFLNTPQVTTVDTINMSNVPLTELDNTANLAALRNLNLATNHRSSTRFDEYYQDTIKIGSAAFIKKDFVEKDSILGDFFAKRVTKTDFEAGKINCPKQLKYQIVVPGLKKQYEVCKILNDMIEQRMTERANYFYQLDLRAWKKDPSLSRPSLATYKAQEVNNLLPSVRSIRAFAENFPYTATIQIVKNGNDENRIFLSWSIEILR